MFKNKLGEDSPIPKFIPLKIRRRDHVESQDLTSKWHQIFDYPWGGGVQGKHWWLHKQTKPNKNKFSC